MLLLLLPALFNFAQMAPSQGNCLYSMQIIPGGPSNVNLTDSNGKRCWGVVQLPMCSGYCKTSESGTHTFPHRMQNSSACVLIQTGYNEVPLTCDNGADDAIRTIKIVKGEKCGCKRFPLD